MRIVSVAAPGNSSGKTMTLSSILRSFPGRMTAVKFTTVFKDGVNCPRTERACACRELHGRFTVITDPATLAMEETDTGRLLGAGASSVLWCLAVPGAHRQAWDHIRSELIPPGARLLTEGNTIVPVLDPDLLVMVMSPSVPRSRWKPDTWSLAERADVVVINRHASDAPAIERLVSEVASRRGKKPAVEDVSRPLDEWSDPSLKDAVAAVLAS